MKTIEECIEETGDEVYHLGVYMTIVYEDDDIAWEWGEKLIALGKAMKESIAVSGEQ